MSSTTQTPPTKNKSHLIWLGGGALILGLLLGWLIIQGASGKNPFAPQAFHGSLIESTTPAANFTLTGPSGKEVSLTDFQDKIVLLYFGYTFCPDICPATLQELKTATNELGAKADQVQILMITVDPERDTPEVLKTYLAHFNPSFIGLSGTAEEVQAATAAMGIFYELHEGTAASGYLVDHTASVQVIDQNGYLKLIYSFDTAGEDMAKDLKRLLK